MFSRTDTAVVLAAGNGTRLAGGTSPGQAPSKPLTRVAGLSLIERTLLTLEREGIRKVVVVTGYRGEEVEEALRGNPRLQGIELCFARNEEWRKSNGISVLAARPHVRGDFLLLMADHVLDRAILRAVQAARVPARGAILAVDRKIGSIYDLDDATKVLVDRTGKVVDIGKDLPAYNCIDTGVFRCTEGLFEALEEARASRGGDCSLSDGIRRLAGLGRMLTCDVGEAWWQDVDTPGSRRHAERLLFESCRKPVDGLVARHINRNISLRISRALVDSPVTPNMMSLFTFALGVLAAMAATRGTYGWLLLAGVLMKANSILDGVDGELARVRFQQSRLGEWLDTLSDDLSNVLFFAGLAIGAASRPGGEHFAMAGAVAVASQFLLSFLFYREIIAKGSGDLYAIDWDFDRDPNSGLAARVLSRLRYVTKKDFFIAVFLVMAVFGILPWALYLAAGGGLGTLVVAVARQIRRRRLAAAPGGDSLSMAGRAAG